MNKCFIFLLTVISFIILGSYTEASQFEEKLKKAKEFHMEGNLGIIIMEMSNIMDSEATNVGYKSYEFYKDTGKTDKVIQVWLLNTSDGVLSVNPLNFKLVTEKGYTVSINNYTFRTKNPFNATELEPGTKAKGMIVFGLDMNDKAIKIIYEDHAGNKVERDYGDAITLQLGSMFK